MSQPFMVVVAGPPGSGKTTYFPVTAFGVDAFDVDDRCAQISGSYRAIPREIRSAVAKECERFVLGHIDQRISFAVETTLRTTVAIEQARLARQRGFVTHPRFVTTNAIGENVERVLQRAQSGGHAASERDIREIYTDSLSNHARAFPVFNRIRVYDATARWEAPTLVATVHDGHLVRHGATPAWLESLVSAFSGDH